MFMFMILFFLIKLVYTPRNLHVIEVYTSIFFKITRYNVDAHLDCIVTKQNTSY
jgi:hypothetical protein